MSDVSPTAAMLIIGNEILSGRTQDANLAFVGTSLAEIGIRLMEARVVPDVEEEIVTAVNALRERYGYLFTTGGIGPTHDDITAACIAKAFGVGFGDHPEAVQRLTEYYGSEHLTEIRLRMARMPEGAVLVENSVSGAPGFRMGNVYVMAGVPSIMRAMFDSIKGELQRGQPIVSRTVTAEVPESRVAKALGEIQERYPDVDVGSYPFMKDGVLGVQLVARGTDAALVEEAEREIQVMVATLNSLP